MNKKDIHILSEKYTTIFEANKGSGPPYILIDEDGGKFYYKDRAMTILHRIDGPAVEYADGNKYWYIDGKLHRTDGPAVEFTNGTKYWYIDDKLHRTDGPALEWADGTKLWYINGKRHRTDGPAVEYAYGAKSWYIDGKELTEDEFNAYHANKKYEQNMKDTGEKPVTDFSAFD